MREGQTKTGHIWATTFVIAQLFDALDGPPTYWVPPCVHPFPIPPSNEGKPAHIPLERGGAAALSSLLKS